MAAAGLLSAMTVLFLAIPKSLVENQIQASVLVPKTRIRIWYIGDKSFLLKLKLENVNKLSINVSKFYEIVKLICFRSVKIESNYSVF